MSIELEAVACEPITETECRELGQSGNESGGGKEGIVQGEKKSRANAGKSFVFLWPCSRSSCSVASKVSIGNICQSKGPLLSLASLLNDSCRV